MSAGDDLLIVSAIRELNYEGYHAEAEAIERLRAAQPVQQPAAVVGQEAYRIMGKAHSFCPLDFSHNDKMRWTADYFLKNYTAPVPAATVQPSYQELLDVLQQVTTEREEARGAAHKLRAQLAAGVQGDDERKPVQAYLVHDLSRRLQAHGWQYSGPGNVFDDLTECLKKSDFLKHEHPNLDVPIDPECSAKLDDLGDDRGQGLDGHWKWGFRAGWKYGQEASSVQPDSGRDAALAMVKDIVKLWDSQTVGADDYNDEMCRIEQRMRALAAHPAPSSDAATMRERFEADVRAKCHSKENADEMLERNSNGFYNVQRVEYMWVGWQSAHPANGAQANLVAKINALRVRGVNYEDGVPARQLVDRAEVLALLGGAS